MVPPCSECHPGSHPSSRTRCCHPLRGRRAFHLQQGTLCCASVSTASIGILVSSSTPVKSTKGVGVSFRQTNGPITDQLKDILLLYLGNMQWWCRWKWQQRKNAAFFDQFRLDLLFLPHNQDGHFLVLRSVWVPNGPDMVSSDKFTSFVALSHQTWFWLAPLMTSTFQCWMFWSTFTRQHKHYDWIWVMVRLVGLVN